MYCKLLLILKKKKTWKLYKVVNKIDMQYFYCRGFKRTIFADKLHG